MTSTLSELTPARAGLPTVSVFGLGYVGCVSAACLAARGHHVVGVDPNRDKMEFLRQGQSPVVEKRTGELTAEVMGAGQLTITAGPAEAVLGSDGSIVCVGTPCASGGGSSTRYLECVIEEIGEALASKDGWHFGDEFGALCAALRPDSHEVMDIFLADMQVCHAVELAEQLIGQGSDVQFYGTNVALSKLLGANRSILEERLRRISQWLADDVESLLEHGEIFIAGTKDPVVVAAIDSLGEDRIVIDLVRLPGEEEQLEPPYVGIGW